MESLYTMVKKKTHNTNCHEKDELTSTGGDVKELGDMIIPPK